MNLAKTALLLTLSITACQLSADSTPLPLESVIDSADIYRNGALVHRSIKLDLPAGNHRIAINKLPVQAQSNDYQLSPDAALAALSIQELSFSTADLAQTINEELLSAIEKTEKAIALLDQEKTVSTQQLSFAQNLAQAFTQNFGQKENQSSIAEAQQTWRFLQETLQEHQQTINRISQEEIELKKTLQKQKKEAQKQHKQAKDLAGFITASLSSAEPIRGSLTLSTFHPEASWQPSYEIHSRINQASVDLRILANIRQGTPENWSNISVQLHAQSLNQFDQAPELSPIRLSPQNYSKLNYRSSSAGNQMDLELAEPMAAKTRAPGATYASQGNSFTAAIADPLNIPNNNEAVQVLIDQSTTQAKYWTTATPRITTHTYLQLQSKNPFAFPLLPGSATIFIGRNLVGSIRLNNYLAQEEMTLSLGRDPNIQITRSETKKFEENSGLIDKTTSLERAYETEVVNHYDTAHRVTIHDQFPLTSNGKITVKPILPKTKDVELDENTGIFHWDLTLPPQSKKTLTTSFEVTYPRDWEISPEL